MSNRKISALVASVIAYTRGRITTRTVTHPTRDWWIGLVMAFGAAVAVITWSASVYLEYKREGFLVNFDPPATTQIYRPELVESALTLMAERADTRQQLLTAAEQVSAGTSVVDDETSGATEEEVLLEEDAIPLAAPDEFVEVISEEPSTTTTATPVASPPPANTDVVDLPFVDETPILE